MIFFSVLDLVVLHCYEIRFHFQSNSLGDPGINPLNLSRKKEQLKKTQLCCWGDPKSPNVYIQIGNSLKQNSIIILWERPPHPYNFQNLIVLLLWHRIFGTFFYLEQYSYTFEIYAIHFYFSWLQVQAYVGIV